MAPVLVSKTFKKNLMVVGLRCWGRSHKGSLRSYSFPCAFEQHIGMIHNLGIKSVRAWYERDQGRLGCRMMMAGSFSCLGAS